MKRFQIYILLGMLIVLSSCEKDIDTYQNDPRVYFFERANDLVATRITSKSFTFLPLPSAVSKDTMEIKVKTMGLPAGFDRTVRGEAITEGSTAEEGFHYDFIDGVVKAGETEGLLKVVMYRVDDIKDKTVQLNLRIAETKDFKVGVTEDNLFTLLWSDNVVMPENWSSLQFFFGPYSTAKYRFIIDVTGQTEFPQQLSARLPLKPGEYSYLQMLDVQRMLNEALTAYNSSHAEPMKDENGLLVSFP